MKNTVFHFPEHHENENIKSKKGPIIALFSIFKSRPNVHEWSLLTAVEVKTLIRTGEWYELYPLYLCDEIIDGTVECKHEVPMIKRLIAAHYEPRIPHDLWYMEKQYKDILSTIEERGYILPQEIKKLKKVWFNVIITEDIPAIFVIAPRHRHRKEGDPAPIILIKYGEDKYFRVSTRNHGKEEILTTLKKQK